LIILLTIQLIHYGNSQNCTDPNCLQCPNDANTCTNCSSLYNLISGKCVYACTDTNCSSCQSNPNICTDCFTPFYVSNSTCVHCTDPNCSYCTANTCTICEVSFHLSQGTCVHDNCDDVKCVSCPNATGICELCSFPYATTNGKCVQATNCDDINCASCPNATGICQICNYPYNIFNGTCVQAVSNICPANQYQDITTLTCKNCADKFPGCKVCSYAMCLDDAVSMAGWLIFLIIVVPVLVGIGIIICIVFCIIRCLRSRSNAYLVNESVNSSRLQQELQSQRNMTKQSA